MKFADNEHLFCYSNHLQQELQLLVVEEDLMFNTNSPLDHSFFSEAYNERDLEVMLDSVGCIDHPA